MPRRQKAVLLLPERGIQYMQLEYFKLYSYCIDQGILKKSRRRTPSGAAALVSPHHSAPLEAAEAALIRLFACALKSVFSGSIGGQNLNQPGMSKQRNILEFIVLLPNGEWWKRGNVLGTRVRQEIAQVDDAESAVYNKFVRFYPPGNTIFAPHILVAPDRKPGSSRWGRRRSETLLKENKSMGHYHDAIKAVVAWKERMDALMTEAAANVENGNQNTD